MYTTTSSYQNKFNRNERNCTISGINVYRYKIKYDYLHGIVYLRIKHAQHIVHIEDRVASYCHIPIVQFTVVVVEAVVVRVETAINIWDELKFRFFTLQFKYTLIGIDIFKYV